MTARTPTLGRDHMLLLLTWAAGHVDALSYLELGRVFTAMMTGNTVLLAVALGQGELVAAGRSVLALAGFVGGAAVAAVIVARDTEPAEWPPAVTRALASETLALALFAVIWHLTGRGRGTGAVHVLIVLSGFAMGIQAGAVRRLGVPGIGSTYITGTLTSLVGDLVGWRLSRSRPSAAPASIGSTGNPSTMNWEQRVGLLAAVFLVYGLGALTGGLLQARSSPLATLTPLVAVGAVVLNAATRQRHRAL